MLKFERVESAKYLGILLENSSAGVSVVSLLRKDLFIDMISCEVKDALDIFKHRDGLDYYLTTQAWELSLGVTIEDLSRMNPTILAHLNNSERKHYFLSNKDQIVVIDGQDLEIHEAPVSIKNYKQLNESTLKQKGTVLDSNSPSSLITIESFTVPMYDLEAMVKVNAGEFGEMKFSLIGFISETSEIAFKLDRKSKDVYAFSSTPDNFKNIMSLIKTIVDSGVRDVGSFIGVYAFNDKPTSGKIKFFYKFLDAFTVDDTEVYAPTDYFWNDQSQTLGVINKDRNKVDFYDYNDISRILSKAIPSSPKQREAILALIMPHVAKMALPVSDTEAFTKMVLNNSIKHKKDSTMMDSFTYDYNTGELLINIIDNPKGHEGKRNKVRKYIYRQVPPILVNSLIATDSAGKFYQSFIRGQYECMIVADEELSTISE